MREDTRQKLIDAAFDEIYSSGYQGASLANILKVAGVHKGSMYHFFKNKKEMALVSMYETIHNQSTKMYTAILELQGGYLDALMSALKDTTLRDFKRGCPVANVIQEMSNIDEDFNSLMRLIYMEFRENFKKVLDKSLQAKEIKECNTAKIALYMTAVLDGAILAAKATGEKQDYLDIIEILEGSLLGLKL